MVIADSNTLMANDGMRWSGEIVTKCKKKGEIFEFMLKVHVESNTLNINSKNRNKKI